MTVRKGGPDGGFAAASRNAGCRIALACVLAWTITSSLHAETLKQAVEIALKTNPKVLAADAERRAVTQDLAQARGGYLPTVDVSVANGPEHTESPVVQGATGTSSANLNRFESGVIVTQNLFAGGATVSEVQRQTARLSAATLRLAQTREEIALRATDAFLEVLKNRQLVKLANENLKAHLDTTDKVRQRVQGGVSQKADLQQALGRVALARSTASAQAGRLRESETNYQAVIGKLPGELLDPQVKSAVMLKSGVIDGSRLSDVLKQASDSAVTSNPSLLAANADIDAADASVRGAKAPYYPRLNLELTANRNKNIAGLQGDFNNDSAMVVMRWNLFRGGSDRAQEQSLAERRYAAIDTAASTKRDVEEKVGVAVHAKATSEERLGYLKEHATLSADVLVSYQQQLDLGRRTLLDVLNAENELFTARSNLASGQYEDLFNQYAVEAAKGLLVQSLGITSSD